MLTNQDRPTKPCPLCRDGRIYTGEGQKLNGRTFAGVQACPSCVLNDTLNRFLNERAN